MKYRNILYTISLATLLVACGSGADRVESSTSQLNKEEKVANYFYQNRNHFQFGVSSTLHTRAFPGSENSAIYDKNTFYITSSGVVKNGSSVLTTQNKTSRTDQHGSYNDSTTVRTNKSNYSSSDTLKIEVKNMLGDSEDWIGIYRYGDNNDWDNVVAWSWTDGKKNTTIKFSGLEAGEYEVRAFFENSFNDVAYSVFSIEGDYNNATGGGHQNVDNNQQDNQNDVKQDNQNDNQDNNNNNANDNNHGNNNNQADAKVFENAEDGISSKWQTILGPYKAKEINGAVKLTTNWISNVYNDAEYHLPMNDNKHTTLEVDLGGVGAAGGHVGGIHEGNPKGFMPHYIVGVYVTTKNGSRVMTWDSWYNHENMDASRADYGGGNVWLTYPSPVEQVRGYGFQDNLNKWEHFKVNLNDYLQQLEPGNKVLKVDTFIATGGYLDNITLSNN